jgi:23S rRNA-/tRNA-specific pseudouridylate synthase
MRGPCAECRRFIRNSLRKIFTAIYNPCSETTLGSGDLIRYRILFQDNHLLVVHKPAGIASQGGGPASGGNMLDAYKAMLRVDKDKTGDAFLGLVHRLDQRTSGLMVLVSERMTLRPKPLKIATGKDLKGCCASV